MSEILIDRTGQPEVIAASDGSLTVTVPIRIKRRGLRKVVTLPDGGACSRVPGTPRRHRSSWRSPAGTAGWPCWNRVRRGHMKEIARREGVDDSYVSRMVNLTTLAPDIVAAILDETLPPEVTLFELAAGTPLLWEEQRGRVGGDR